jgi:hypothetical protein
MESKNMAAVKEQHENHEKFLGGVFSPSSFAKTKRW